MSETSSTRFFGNLDDLAATSRLVVDRPAGSRHRGCRRPCIPSTTATWRALWPRTAAVWTFFHTNQHDYGLRRQDLEGLPEEFIAKFEEFRSIEFEAEHPVVRVHPETGERALVLGGFVKQLKGVSQTQSALLLNIFAEVVSRPENQVRWHWNTGDVAIWDNRATQHYAVNDYTTEPRIVHRVTVAGDLPVGTDGRPSVVRAGDASTYSPIAGAPDAPRP